MSGQESFGPHLSLALALFGTTARGTVRCELQELRLFVFVFLDVLCSQSVISSVDLSSCCCAPPSIHVGSCQLFSAATRTGTQLIRKRRKQE